MKRICFAVCLLLQIVFVQANTRLPKIFGDNMVLQRNQPIPVWGWATANEKISVHFNKQVKYTKADKNGNWLLRLDAEAAGGPYQLIVNGRNNLTINNVLVGEVWVCSGQSNMEMPIAGWGKINNYQQEIADASFPEIRQLKVVPVSLDAVPGSDIKGEWKLCSPETAGEFTAAGYFFARELYRQLHVPIGLINSSWGGTHVETWTSRVAFEKSDAFKAMISSMPTTNLAAAGKLRNEKLLKNIASLHASAGAGDWHSIAFDDSKWPVMHLPGVWEAQRVGLEDLDGIVIFRKTIVLDEKDAQKPAVLELAKIDDNDETYVNGTKVGATNKYSDKRVYQIPAGTLQAGKNSIVIRVEDTGGSGGIYGNADEMKLTIGNMSKPLSGDWSFAVDSIAAESNSVDPNSYPTLLFNSMINPLIPFAIKGVIWYQGEANADRAYQYRIAFPMMITDWREHWGEGEFPFIYVQLSSFGADNGNSLTGSKWAELREAQTMTLSLPNTGMVVTTDIGDSADIHPKDKQDVGNRLAVIALNKVYGKNMEDGGPLYKSMKVDGKRIVLSFTHIGKGLFAKDKYGYLKGFEIAGSDQKFHYAKAIIEGENVLVYQDSIDVPSAVRYGWSDYAPEANLFNKDGFPASPFRTDQWKGITESKKFEINK